jgi:GntR family transcriptional regulator
LTDETPTAIDSSVTRALPSPRYYQVYVTLRAWVRDSTYGPGQQIPTEAQLCETFGVSRITIRKAVDELVREGWLVRHQGRGTFVEMSAARAPSTIDLHEVLHQVEDLGALTAVRDVQVREIAPDEETRAALELAPGVAVQKATHVRLLHAVPLAFITTFVPLDVARRLAGEQVPGQPMLALIARAGIRLAAAEQWIGATLAGIETARSLGVEVGAPLLKITRIVAEERGRPVERVVALYRADAYQYRMHLGSAPGPRAPAGPRVGGRGRRG